MPSIQQNLQWWNSEFMWNETNGGEVWSDPWGSTQTLWYGSLLPRISSFLPCKRVLEIAPGFGRITHFLKDIAEELILVDLSKECIASCRDRFSSYSHISYYVNDGLSLEMVEDASVDFIISFDSLVHVERPVIESYLRQGARKLTENGAIFLHHSNLFHYLRRGLLHMPPEVILRENVNPGSRGPTVDIENVSEIALEHGLSIICQEVFPWGGASLFDTELLCDAFSLLTKKGSRFECTPRVHKNKDFFRNEVARLKEMALLYNPNQNKA